MSIMKKYKKKFHIFKDLLAKENPVIVEIGAHFGEDSMRFCEVFKDPTIYCIEPDPRCIKIFKKHVKNKNIKLYEVAFSDKNGEMNFYQSYKPNEIKTPEKYNWISDDDYKKYKLGNSGSSSLKKGYKHILDETIKVQVVRFDDWAEQNNIEKLDLAWIDVQGSEKNVLTGMGDSIHKIKYIWIEYGEKEYEGAMSRQETISYMTDKGYQVINFMSSFSDSGDLMFESVK